MPDEPVPDDAAGLRAANARLRAVMEAKDGQVAVLERERLESARKVTEWALPGLSCPCCGTVTFAEPPAGAHQGSVSYGPALNAAVILSFRVSRSGDLRCPVVDSVGDGTLAA